MQFCGFAGTTRIHLPKLLSIIVLLASGLSNDGRKIVIEQASFWSQGCL